MPLDSAPAGLGSQAATLTVCLANRPPAPSYQGLTQIQPLATGELDHIVRHSSNHWRKVFNVYAKLVWSLNQRQPGWVHGSFRRWQDFRDAELLQAHSQQCLLFTPPVAGSGLVVIAGKTWAQQLGMATQLQWLDAHFAVHAHNPWFVSPYFDYRQLTNARIEQLVTLLLQRAAEPLA